MFQPHIYPYGTVLGASNSTQLTQLHPWGRAAEYARSRPQIGTQDQYPLCPPCLPPLGTSMPGHREPFLMVDVATSCPSEDRPFPPRPLGENHKNKTGARYVLRGMFSPCSHFIKLFGPGHRPWGIWEASQRYPCNRPNYLPAPTSSEVAFGSLAADVFKLAHLLSACIYKQTLLMFLSKLPPPESLPSLYSLSQSHILFDTLV